MTSRALPRMGTAGSFLRAHAREPGSAQQALHGTCAHPRKASVGERLGTGVTSACRRQSTGVPRMLRNRTVGVGTGCPGGTPDVPRSYLSDSPNGQPAIGEQLSDGEWTDQRYVEFASTTPEGAARALGEPQRTPRHRAGQTLSGPSSGFPDGFELIKQGLRSINP